MSKRFNPNEKSKLDRPSRHDLLKPAETLRKLGLEPGMVMADIGCGTGFFSIPASAIIGDQGLIYAADIEPLMLQTISERLSSAEFPQNIHVVHTGNEIQIAPESCDFVLFAFVLHEVEARQAMLNKAGMLLKRGGKAAVIEWKKESSKTGPPASHRISADQMISEFNEAGFRDIEKVEISAGVYAVTAIN